MAFIYDLKPQENVYALLEGSEMASIVPENNRVWWTLSFYSSEKSRLVAAKKRKRHSPSAIFMTWGFSLEDIIKQGKWILVQQSDKVLLSDKLDILRQLLPLMKERDVKRTSGRDTQQFTKLCQ